MEFLRLLFVCISVRFVCLKTQECIRPGQGPDQGPDQGPVENTDVEEATERIFKSDASSMRTKSVTGKRGLNQTLPGLSDRSH